MRKKLLFLFAALLCSLSMFADGALSGKFTINQYGDQISFSQGNLQYRQSDNTYRFALSQYTIQGASNKTALETIDAGGNTSVYIDLFGWGAGRCRLSARCNNQAADANGNGEIEIGDVTTILTIMAGGE